MKQSVGITSTIPSEVVFAAGLTPVDLNNLFIASPDPYALVEIAESAGFPRNYCAWIKGIYGALKDRPDIDTVIGVMQGDCGNTAALMDVIASEGRRVIPFAYPASRDADRLSEEITRLAGALGTDSSAAERWRATLKPVRELAGRIDTLTWQDGLVTGLENHLALIGTSDFAGDPESYAANLSDLIATADRRVPARPRPRLALVGVPPIAGDLFDLIAGRGADVVYNEVQREFSMPRAAASLAEQYAGYTYPYGSIIRAAEIKRQVELRKVDGIVHYVQNFCYHQLDDLVFRDSFEVPVLRLEADKPGPLDERSRLRLEAFIETLLSRFDVG
jgi:benzoyl-CoA reductase/2-hydroxyglutaryl-CoA dehydratase subunit BcrC/BadD/HgdB